MNKNIKRIVAMALAIGVVSAVAPATNVNLLTTKAYAEDDENDDETLDSLELKTSSGSTIKLYSDDGYDSDDKVDSDDVEDEETYYAKTSSNTINIDIDGPSTKYVKVFKGTSKSTKGKSITSDISLSSGTTTLVVRVYSSKPESDIKYEDDDDVTSEYKIKIKYTGSDSDDEDDDAEDYDDIYLEKLTVAGENISLSDSKVTYTYNVASDIDKVTVKAVPEDEDYTVTINDDEVDDDDNYKTTVSLKTGVNKIEIELEDEDNDEERVYTLKITRGNTSSTSTSTATTTPNTATNVVNTAVKANQWVQANGVWQYNDSMGNPIKNSWFPDKNYGKTYYLQADGSMATGWLSNNGKWYYLGTDGAMRTGWILDGSKYYYLYSEGNMAYSTTINGYKLGANGAWIR